MQLQDGDTLVVNTRQGVAAFNGPKVENPVQIEFAGGEVVLEDALQMVGVMPVTSWRNVMWNTCHWQRRRG